ncbi:MAG: hypothetical protein NXI30_20810 [bacterium]|nr:hypothetical protein [bacterium]
MTHLHCGSPQVSDRDDHDQSLGVITNELVPEPPTRHGSGHLQHDPGTLLGVDDGFRPEIAIVAKAQVGIVEDDDLGGARLVAIHSCARAVPHRRFRGDDVQTEKIRDTPALSIVRLAITEGRPSGMRAREACLRRTRCLTRCGHRVQLDLERTRFRDARSDGRNQISHESRTTALPAETSHILTAPADRGDGLAADVRDVPIHRDVTRD